MNDKEAKQLIARTIQEVNAHSRVVTIPQCESTSTRILQAVEKTSNHVLRVNESIRKLSDEIEVVRLDVQVHLAQHRGENTGVHRMREREKMWLAKLRTVAAWIGASAAGGGAIYALLRAIGHG